MDITKFRSAEPEAAATALKYQAAQVDEEDKGDGGQSKIPSILRGYCCFAQ